MPPTAYSSLKYPSGLDGWLTFMCNLITTNQEAIRALFGVINRYVGNLPPMPGVFPDYPAPVVRNAGTERDGSDALGHAAAATCWRRTGHEYQEHAVALRPRAKRGERGMWSGSFVEPWRYRACRRTGGSPVSCSISMATLQSNRYAGAARRGGAC
jgi:hypothetical protein